MGKMQRRISFGMNKVLKKIKNIIIANISGCCAFYFGNYQDSQINRQTNKLRKYVVVYSSTHV